MLAKTANMTTDCDSLGKLFRNSHRSLRNVSTAGRGQVLKSMNLPVNKRKNTIDNIKRTVSKLKNRDKRMDIWKA